MKFNAFISYSHRQDSTLAPNLEKALEQVAKHTFIRRSLSIFTDSNDHSASPTSLVKSMISKFLAPEDLPVCPNDSFRRVSVTGKRTMIEMIQVLKL